MTRALLAALAVLLLASPAFTLDPIPDKLVVLTFDDSAKSHYSVARPILTKYKFGATFFITEGFDFPTNKKDYMTWEEIAQLHKDGFEIGNHTRDHKSVTEKTLADLPAQLRGIVPPRTNHSASARTRSRSTHAIGPATSAAGELQLVDRRAPAAATAATPGPVTWPRSRRTRS